MFLIKKGLLSKANYCIGLMLLGLLSLSPTLRAEVAVYNVKQQKLAITGPKVEIKETATMSLQKKTQNLKQLGSGLHKLLKIKSQQGKKASSKLRDQIEQDWRAFQKLLEEIGELKQDVRAEFQETANRIASLSVSSTFAERLRNTQAQFETQMTLLENQVQQLPSQHAATLTVDQMRDFNHIFEAKQMAMKHHVNNLEKSSFGPRKVNEALRKPMMTKAALRNYLKLPGAQKSATETQPTDADLAEGEEIQINQAIRDLVANLDNDPLAIYKYVLDNTHFTATYGSVRGSISTLETNRGNDIDIASLLVAMLRAANIPARYQYGTVEVPIDRLMNWLGNIHKPEAALSLLAQGNIPHLAMYRGTTLEAVRLEHVWVSAWLNYTPGQGVGEGAAETWVPMDASFKQYTYTQGLDVAEVMGLEPDQYFDDYFQDTEFNTEEQYVLNPVDATFQADVQAAFERLNNHMNTQFEEPKLSDLMPSRTLQDLEIELLSAGLPYTHIATSGSFSKVPDHLRHKFRIDMHDQEGNQLFSMMRNTLELVDQEIAIDGPLATEDDLIMFDRLLPESGVFEGSSFDFPGYLVHVKPQIAINGETVAASPVSVPLGTDMQARMGFFVPGEGWDLIENPISAGSYRAVGLSMQGVSGSFLSRMMDDLETVKQKIDNIGDQSLFETTNNHELVGRMFQAVVHTYLASMESQGMAVGLHTEAVYVPHNSMGTFGTQIENAYFLGVPLRTHLGAASMDIDRLRFSIVDRHHRVDKLKDLIISLGFQSSRMEHQIPEEMLLTETDAPANSAVSTFRALQFAAIEGQRIYRISRENLDQVLPLIQAESHVIEEIQTWVEQGNEAMVHTSPVQVGQWVGTGYVLLDSETGAGSYRITSGQNGAVLFYLIFILLTVLLIALIIVLLPFSASLATLVATGSSGVIATFMLSGAVQSTAQFVAITAGSAVFTGGLMTWLLDGAREDQDWGNLATWWGVMFGALGIVLSVLFSPIIGAILAIALMILAIVFAIISSEASQEEVPQGTPSEKTGFKTKDRRNVPFRYLKPTLQQ